MYMLSMSKRSPGGQDVTSVVECAEDDAAISAAALIARQRLDQSMVDVEKLQALADEEVALRRDMIERGAYIDALMNGEPALLKPFTDQQAAAVERLQALRAERSAIIERNA
jgi:hypothetical protein